MKAVILVVFVLTVAAVLCLLEAYREQQYFKVTEDGVVSRRLNGLKKEKKIVFLSDLHNKEYGVGNERLLDAICKARPDLILIGGDMLVGKKGCSVAPALKFVSKLPAIAPVYYACGNHEQRMKRKPEVYGEVYQAYQKQLEECGVHFLENSSVLLKEDDCRIRISALELPLATYTKFKKYRVTEQDVTACIEKEAADYEILLAHNPVYFDAYKKLGSRSGAFRASSRRDYPSAGNRRSDHASGDSVSEIFRGDDNRRRADDHCKPWAWHSYDQSSFFGMRQR